MASNTINLVGVNLAGAEFGSGTQSYGSNYEYPTHDEIDYEASKGMNVIRIPFSWERLQPNLNGTLDTTELARLDDAVNYATSKGLKIDLDVHNYGKYGGNLIGSSAVPNSAFADLWSKLAVHYQTNSNVIFGLMNEPAQTDASGWLTSVNTAISAIRANGATQEILVPGINYDGAWTWVGTPNATVITPGIVDSGKNYALEVHQYLDQDGSGTSDTVATGSNGSTTNNNIGMDRLSSITQWAQQNGQRLFLGEIGVPIQKNPGNDPTIAAQNTDSLSALGNSLSYINQNSSVWQGVTLWAAGPLWTNYPYSVEPTSDPGNTANKGYDDAPQMTVLDQYAPGSALVSPVAGPPTIQGTHTVMTTADGPVGPFTNVTIADGSTTANTTETLTIALTGAGGTPKDGATFDGSFTLKQTAANTYTLAGTAAAVTTELDALSFTPTVGQPGTSATTNFTLTDKSSTGASSTADNKTVVTDTDPAVVPTVSGTHASATMSESTVTPFSGVTVADRNGGGPTEILIIALAGGGGTLSGAGTRNADGTYMLTGTAAQVTSQLDAVAFTPTAGQPGTSTSTTFTLTVRSSASTSSATDSNTMITDANPAVQTTSAPVQTVPAPAQTVPAPAQTVPAPAQTVPAPAQTVPAPVQTVPAPVQIAPTPAQTTPMPVPVAPAPVALDAVSLDKMVSYSRGTFILTGTVSSAAGLSSVEVSANVDGTEIDLGPAAVDPEGTFSFSDKIGAHFQGFITATETDGAGAKMASADPGFSLTGGLGPMGGAGRQTTYTTNGSAETSRYFFRANGQRSVDVQSSGQIVDLSSYDVVSNHRQGSTTFVYTSGAETNVIDVIHGFKLGGQDHSMLEFPSDFKNFADMLRHTGDVNGSAFITVPVTGDAIRLAGVTTAELKAHPKDFKFHV